MRMKDYQGSCIWIDPEHLKFDPDFARVETWITDYELPDITCIKWEHSEDNAINGLKSWCFMFNPKKLGKSKLIGPQKSARNRPVKKL